MLDNFMWLLSSATFSVETFVFKNIPFRNTNRVSNSMGPDNV